MMNRQQEIHEWSLKNFPEQTATQSLLGVVEEVGELAHHVLKKQQNITQHEDHDCEIKDAIGDIVIFLSEFCSRSGIDLEECVEEVWGRVQKRTRKGWGDDREPGSIDWSKPPR